METRTGVASIVSSCERLAAEADGRILLGTGSNRASCFWGCHCRGRQREVGWVWSSARLIRVSQAEEKKKDKEKEETRRFLSFGCTARTWTSTCACLCSIWWSQVGDAVSVIGDLRAFMTKAPNNV